MTIEALNRYFEARAGSSTPVVASGLLARAAMALAYRRMGGCAPPYYLEGEEELRDQIVDEVRRRLKITEGDTSDEALRAIEEALDGEMEAAGGPVDYAAAQARLASARPPDQGLEPVAGDADRVPELSGLSEAQPAFERAPPSGDAAVGAQRPEIARDLSDRAMALRDLGALEEARMQLERALAVGEKVFGEKHPEVAGLLRNLGSVLAATGDRRGAAAAFGRSLAIYEAMLGSDDPRTRAVGMALAEAERERSPGGSLDGG